MTTLPDLVRAAVSKHRMFRRGERVLVAVSGGPDSTALLACLVALVPEWRIHLRAVYVNHGLRPAAARREAQRVRDLGRRWAVPVSIVAKKIRRGKGESPESAARRVRYAALQSCAWKYSCRTIALGHTQDDQAETVLLWILRGTGTTGLAGIPPVRQMGTAPLRMVRPLLQVSRREIEQFLKSQGIRPLLDHSNLSGRFLRNRIRRELIPLLERKYNPQLRRHLAELAEILRMDSEWAGRRMREEFRRVARVRGPATRLNRSLLRKEHPALRRGILRLAVARLQGDGTGLSHLHWEALDRLLTTEGRGALDLPHGFRVEKKEGDYLMLRRRRFAGAVLRAGLFLTLLSFSLSSPVFALRSIQTEQNQDLLHILTAGLEETRLEGLRQQLLDVSLDSKAYEEAAGALSAEGSPEARKILREVLKSQAPETSRLHAAVGLAVASPGGQEDLEALLVVLRHGDSPEWLAAMASLFVLFDFKNISQIEEVVQAVESAREKLPLFLADSEELAKDISGGIDQSLSMLRLDRQRLEQQQVLLSPQATSVEKIEAVWQLGSGADPRIVPNLVQLLATPEDPKVKSEAVRVLADLHIVTGDVSLLYRPRLERFHQERMQALEDLARRETEHASLRELARERLEAVRLSLELESPLQEIHSRAFAELKQGNWREAVTLAEEGTRLGEGAGIPRERLISSVRGWLNLLTIIRIRSLVFGTAAQYFKRGGYSEEDKRDIQLALGLTRQLHGRDPPLSPEQESELRETEALAATFLALFEQEDPEAARGAVLRSLVIEGPGWAMLAWLEVQAVQDIRKRILEIRQEGRGVPEETTASHLSHTRNALAYWFLLLKSPESSFEDSLPRSVWAKTLLRYILGFTPDPRAGAVPLDRAVEFMERAAQQLENVPTHLRRRARDPDADPELLNLALVAMHLVARAARDLHLPTAANWFTQFSFVFGGSLQRQHSAYRIWWPPQLSELAGLEERAEQIVEFLGGTAGLEGAAIQAREGFEEAGTGERELSSGV